MKASKVQHEGTLGVQSWESSQSAGAGCPGRPHTGSAYIVRNSASFRCKPSRISWTASYGSWEPTTPSLDRPGGGPCPVRFSERISITQLVWHIIEIRFARCIRAADRFKFCKPVPPGEVGQISFVAEPGTCFGEGVACFYVVPDTSRSIG